jgi:hypothetical protein
MERGAEDVDAFKELANSLSLQHRGQTDHSQYMKPSCQRMPAYPARNKANPVDVKLDAIGGQEKKATERRSRAKDDKRMDPDELGNKPNRISRVPTLSSEPSGHGERTAGPLQNGVLNTQAKTNQSPTDDRVSPRQERETQKSVDNSPISKANVNYTKRRGSRASATSIAKAKLPEGGISAKFGNIALFVCFQEPLQRAH